MLEPRSSNGRQVLSPVREDVVAPHWLCYAYDKAGNMLKKQILRSGRARSPSAPQSDDYVTTTFTFDAANQLVSSTTDGVTTRYAYDAAGRLVKEGSKTYRYGYLDKVMSVTDGDTTRTYTYHADGQLASATVGGEHRAPRDRVGPPGGRPLPESETFLWDGLALIQRGGESFVNEPHVGGGNPVASSKGTTYFNDALGTTVGAKKDGKYSAAALTAFGEDFSVNSSGESSSSPFPVPHSPFFTGKPFVEGLGHAFLMRNYRAGLAKWQTADPLGYPDGWNQLAYCGNGVTGAVDLWGCKEKMCDGDAGVINIYVPIFADNQKSDEPFTFDSSGKGDKFRRQIWVECNHKYSDPQYKILIGNAPGYHNWDELSGTILYDGQECYITYGLELVVVDQNEKMEPGNDGNNLYKVVKKPWIKYYATVYATITGTTPNGNTFKVNVSQNYYWDQSEDQGWTITELPEHKIFKKPE